MTTRFASERSRWDSLSYLLWPVTGFTVAWYNAPEGGTPLCAALGGLLGCLLARRLDGLALRLPTVWLLGLVLIGAGGLTRHWALSAELPTRLLGPEHLILWSLNLGWMATLAVVCGLLRLSANRYRFLSVAEAAVAGLTFVALFSAHREGMINRPFFLVDPLWSRGIDPMPVFLAVGGVVAVFVAFLSLSHHRGRRSWVDLVALMALIAAIFLLIPVNEIKNLQEKLNRSSQGDKPKDKPSSKNGKGDKDAKADKDGKGKDKGDKDKSEQEKDQDDPSFSSSQDKQKNPPPVAVVIFRDNYTPEAGYYYFRQSANSEYNGIKLVHTNDRRFDQDLPQRFAVDEGGPGETVGMTLPKLDEGAFRSLPTRVALMHQHNKPFGMSNPVRFWAAQNPDTKRFQKAYEVESRVLTLAYKQMVGRKGGEPDWDAETWAHYTQGPSDPRYKAMVSDILSKLPPQYRDQDFFKAVAIKLWLDEHTTYSLDSPHANSRDPVGDYLFGDRIGYCVFTSHSACYLYRAAGVPARIANGYAVNAQQRGSGSALLIRANEAHSWPEIYLSGLGWMALDIAPKKNLVPPQDQLDQGLQQMLGDMARQDKEHKNDKPQVSIDLQQLLYDLVRALFSAAPWAVLLGILALYATKLYRRFCPFLPGVSPERLAVDAYRSALDSLADRGRAREPGLSREEFARQVERDCPALMRLTLLNLQARLAGRWERPDAYLQSLGEARAQLSRLPRNKWDWLRLLHPASWWKVR